MAQHWVSMVHTAALIKGVLHLATVHLDALLQAFWGPLEEAGRALPVSALAGSRSPASEWRADPAAAPALSFRAALNVPPMPADWAADGSGVLRAGPAGKMGYSEL